MKKWLLSGFLFLFSMAALAAPQNLNLSQALKLIEENSLELQQYKKDLQIAEREEKNAYYSFFPSLSFSATHGWHDSRPDIYQSPWASQLGLQLTENLYDNGESYKKYKIAEAHLQKAKLTYNLQRNQLLQDTANKFYEYIYKAKRKSALEEQNDLIQKQFTRAERDYLQGYKSEKDYLRFKTDLSRSQIQVIQVNSDIKKAKLDLILALSLPPESIAEYEFVVANESDTFNNFKFEKVLLDSHPQIQVQNLQKQIYDQQSALAERNYWPKINFKAEATYGSSDYIGTGSSFSDNEQTELRALITLEYDLFDWGINHRTQEISLLKISQNRNDLEIQKKNLIQALESLYSEIQQNQEHYKLATQLNQLEQKNVNNLQIGYRSGTVTYLELTTGMQNLINSRISLLNTELDLKKNQFSLWYHQGNIYEKLAR